MSNVRDGVLKPFNYIGCKYRILNQILPHFPDNVHNFVDLFCGSGSVFMNVDAKCYIVNDYRRDLYLFWKAVFSNIDFLSEKVDELNREFKTDKDAYFNFRDRYNELLMSNREKQLMMLFDIAAMFYILVNTCINNMARWNKKGKFNQAWGERNCQNKILELKPRVDKVRDNVWINNVDFTVILDKILNSPYGRSFLVYCDPPYLAQKSSFEWSFVQEQLLLDMLLELDRDGVKWALSNQLSSVSFSSNDNDVLRDWIAQHGFKVIDIDIRYNSGTVDKRNKDGGVKEVLVINYIKYIEM